MAETSGIHQLLDVLYRWIHTHNKYGNKHRVSQQADMEVIEAVQAAEPPIALQYLLGAVFRDNKLVPIDSTQYKRSLFVTTVLRHAGVQEIVFADDLSPEAVNTLGEILAGSVLGPTSLLDDQELEGMTWRPIPIAQRGVALENADTEAAATVGVALAVIAAERLPQEGNWPWSDGMDIVRRLEHATQTHSAASLMAVECSDTWSIGRRAVSATLHVLAVLRKMNISSATLRAAAHAELIIATRGLAAFGGQPFSTVATSLSEHLFGKGGGGRFEPHHMRVAAILHAVANRGKKEGRPLAILPLLQLAYLLECRRLPHGSAQALTRLELLALANAEPNYPASWTRTLIKSVGIVPPGTVVAMPDGRAGVVIGPGPTAWRPEVLVDDQRTVPDSDVRLLSRRRGNP